MQRGVQAWPAKMPLHYEAIGPRYSTACPCDQQELDVSPCVPSAGKNRPDRQFLFPKCHILMQSVAGYEVTGAIFLFKFFLEVSATQRSPVSDIRKVTGESYFIGHDNWYIFGLIGGHSVTVAERAQDTAI